MRVTPDLLLPQPLEASPTGDRLALTGPPTVSIDGPPERASRALRHLDRGLRRNALPAAEPGPVGSAALIKLVLTPADDTPPDEYRLRIAADGIVISSAAGRGLFNGVSTLEQWIRLHGHGIHPGSMELPGLEILDRPDFRHRGVMLDVSRNKVPTFDTLLELVERFASWKINQLQLYVEHTFAYRQHETVWRDASPLTGDEIRRLDAYCKERYIDLVPNQQSFGHMHRWLRHEPYRHLAERPDGVAHPFSPEREPFSLCATDPQSLDLIAELYDELLPNFSSALFNVGLDETFDLGTGRSAGSCKTAGKHRVYLDYLLAVHQLAGKHGRRIQFWGDIALQHPELIGELPPDAIALNWGHEADHPFDDETEALAAAGLEFYVCPGTSSWSSFAGRADNALRNLGSAARAGKSSGATGYLITDWGDHGHLQPLTSSWLGFLAGAALAWNTATEISPSKPLWQQRLDVHAYNQPDSGLGRLTMSLGNVYLATGTPCINGTPLFHLLMSPHDDLEHGRYSGLSIHRLEVVLAAVGHALADLTTLGQELPDELAVRELQWVAAALALAGRVGIERFAAGTDVPINELPPEIRAELLQELGALVDEIPPLWLARNRAGGLPDSMRRLAPLQDLLRM